MQAQQAQKSLDIQISAHEMIYRSLKNDIMHGEIPPETALTLRGVAQKFLTSMTPAREALRRLSSEGALKMTSSGRFITTKLTPERIEELSTLRGLLEPELAARALPRAHNALIDRLYDINTRCEQHLSRANVHGYIQGNLEFHRILYLRAQSPAMLALVETIWLQLGPTMRQLYEIRKDIPSTATHRRIISALKAGDEPGLRISVRADVTSALKMLMI